MSAGGIVGAVGRRIRRDRLGFAEADGAKATGLDTALDQRTHHLVRADGQWLIDADYSDAAGQPITAADLPARFTVAVPGDQE